MSEITDKVTNIVVDLLDVKADAVTADANFRKDLGADSLDLVELIMEFENEFGGEISDEEAMEITTVGQAISFINDRMVAS